MNSIENENQTQTLPTDLEKLYELFLSTQLINQATELGKDHQTIKHGKHHIFETNFSTVQNLMNCFLIHLISLPSLVKIIRRQG